MQNLVMLSKLMRQAVLGKRPEIRQLLSSSTELIVFGSSAAGLRRSTSDLDVLCVTDRTAHYKDRLLDLLCLSAKDVRGSAWLCSELANHIAKYGVWMTEKAEWVGGVHLDDIAVHSKQLRLQSYASALEDRWDKLSEVFKQKYVVKLRRETQRLILLRERVAVPPTLLLDNEWLANAEESERVVSIITQVLQSLSGSTFGDMEKRLQAERASKTVA